MNLHFVICSNFFSQTTFRNVRKSRSSNFVHPVYLRKFHKPHVRKPIIPNTSPLLIFHCSSPLPPPFPRRITCSRAEKIDDITGGEWRGRRKVREIRNETARSKEIYRAGGESAQIFGSDDLEATRRGTRRMFRVTEPPYMENHRRCNLRHCLPATRIVYNGAIHFSYGRAYELLSCNVGIRVFFPLSFFLSFFFSLFVPRLHIQTKFGPWWSVIFVYFAVVSFIRFSKIGEKKYFRTCV